MIFIALVIFLLGGVVWYTSKDKILYSYYIKKGDESNSPEIAINYYVDGLKVQYTSEIISRINNKIIKDENFEETLKGLKGIISNKDLDKMYIKVYINKAQESFDEENYRTTRRYLNKAEDYEYDVKEFKYYEELLDKEAEENKEIHIYHDMPMSNYYIIPDSNTRYLTYKA